MVLCLCVLRVLMTFLMTSKSAGGVPFFIGFDFRCSFQPANAGDAPRAREICVYTLDII